jgi:hypothetical protein
MCVGLTPIPFLPFLSHIKWKHPYSAGTAGNGILKANDSGDQTRIGICVRTVTSDFRPATAPNQD